MEAYLQHLITQSVALTLAVVLFITFFESLALMGLLLPGTVIMASIGALIGTGEVSFYPAWGAAMAGCLLGDWLSYFIGRYFKQPLHRWSLVQKYRPILDKTEYALHQHSMVTVLLGRFIGFMRPVVPMVAGMLDLPIRKFAVPNIIGCLTWPPVYFLPGILAGVAIDIPVGTASGQFKWLLFITLILLWLAGWLLWRWQRMGKRASDRLTIWLPLSRLRWSSILASGVAVASLYLLITHPLMPLYRHLLAKVLGV